MSPVFMFYFIVLKLKVIHVHILLYTVFLWGLLIHPFPSGPYSFIAFRILLWDVHNTSFFSIASATVSSTSIICVIVLFLIVSILDHLAALPNNPSLFITNLCDVCSPFYYFCILMNYYFPLVLNGLYVCFSVKEKMTLGLPKFDMRSPVVTLKK